MGTHPGTGRLASPEEIADVILFLASDDSRYIVGETIEVTGGKPVAIERTATI